MGIPSAESIIPGLRIKRVPVLLMLTSVPLVTFSMRRNKSTSYDSSPGLVSFDLISFTIIYLPENKLSTINCRRCSWPKNSRGA